MRVVFLPSSNEDVRWFTRYYQSVFPEGRGNARERMRKTLATLADNPKVGHDIDLPGLRKLPITRTPFSLVYRITNNRIEILQVPDGRANRSFDARD